MDGIRRIFWDRNGSVTVFVLVFFVSLIMLFFAFIQMAKNTAVQASGEKLGKLWCDSVLGEYDRNLKNKYGIYGFYGQILGMQDLLNEYAEATFKEKRYVHYDGVLCDLDPFSLSLPEKLKAQIHSAAKIYIAEDLAKKERNDSPDREAEVGGKQRTKDTKLLFQDLPSTGKSSEMSLAALKNAVKNVHSPERILQHDTSKYLEKIYIDRHFQDLRAKAYSGKTWFQCEKEYLVVGNISEKKNQNGVRRRIVCLREVFNLAFLMNNPEKRGKAMALAELINPVAAPAVEKLLLAAWALAESENDYALLIKGEKVPLIKDKDSWALELEKILKTEILEQRDMELQKIKEENVGSSKLESTPREIIKRKIPCVDPGNEKGSIYRDYVDILIGLMDEDTVLLRIMDLIQINMKYCCYRDFLLQDYRTGICAVFAVNGKNCEIRREYEQTTD